MRSCDWKPAKRSAKREKSVRGENDKYVSNGKTRLKEMELPVISMSDSFPVIRSCRVHTLVL